MSAASRPQPDLDPFRARQLPDIGRRFIRERDRHRRQADLMWAGTLVSMFTDHELRLLNDAGLLCQHDLDLIKQVRRNRD